MSGNAIYNTCRKGLCSMTVRIHAMYMYCWDRRGCQSAKFTGHIWKSQPNREFFFFFSCIASWSGHYRCIFFWGVTNSLIIIQLAMFRIFHIISNFNTAKISSAWFLHGSQNEDRVFGLLWYCMREKSS